PRGRRLEKSALPRRHKLTVCAMCRMFGESRTSSCSPVGGRLTIRPRPDRLSDQPAALSRRGRDVCGDAFEPVPAGATITLGSASREQVLAHPGAVQAIQWHKAFLLRGGHVAGDTVAREALARKGIPLGRA